MKAFAHFLRYAIGVFFIFSGTVKAIDPKGTAIKMEEYFMVFTEYFPALNSLWELSASLSLEISIFMCALEIILGIAFLFGSFFNISWLLMFGMIVFFTFLTGFTLTTGKVTDCGCFGDFIKLKPAQTFWKDVFLSVMLLPLWFMRGYLKEKLDKKSLNMFFIFTVLFTIWQIFAFFNYQITGNSVIVITMTLTALLYGFLHSSNINKTIPAIATVLLSLGATWFTFRNVTHLPIVDFRAYQVGTNLNDCASDIGLDPGEVEIVYILEKDGEKMNDVPSAEYSKFSKEGWKFVDRVDKVIREPELPKCKDFIVVNENGDEIQADILDLQKGTTLWITSPDPKGSDKEGFKKVNSLVKQAKAQGMDVLGLSSGAEIANEYAEGLYTFNSLDAVPIKTMNRSNPGVMVVKNGVLVGKYHCNYLPDISELPR